MSEIANCTMQGRMSVFCPKNCKKCRLGVDNGPGLRYNNRRRREQHPGTPHGVCGRSSSGRAPPCQGGGSEFEPRRPLQTNSKEPVYAGFLLIMVTWPSGKARVCKTLIRQFKSARHLHKTVMKKDVTVFFCCSVENRRLRQPIFRHGFTVLSNHFRAVFPP